MNIKTGLLREERKRVNLDSSFPALRPCRFCGHKTGVLTGPTDLHAEGVRCEKCHRHIGWLPASFSEGVA